MAESETPAKLEIVFSKALTLEIPSSEPTSSVASSSQSSSPIGMLDSSCETSASCSSLPIPLPSQPPLNVKFAPLPELAPRKRRSTAPLGMAARAQLVRRRRNHYSQDPDPGPRYNAGSNPMWTEQELAEARMKQIAAAMERERQRREAAGTYDPNDPLVVLGKKVKEASKQLWKKVSKKDMKDGTPSLEKEEGEEGANRKESESSSNSSLDGKPPSSPISLPSEGQNCNDTSKAPPSNTSSTPRSSTPISSKPSTPIDPSPPLRSILKISTPPAPLPERRVEVVHVEEEEQGGVWEEEIDPHFPLNASQVENSYDALVLSRRRSAMLNVSNFPAESSSDDCSTPTNSNPDAKLDAATELPRP